MMLANIGDFLFRYRNLLFPLCLPLALLPGPDVFDQALIAATVGFAVAAVGEAVRASTIGSVEPCHSIRIARRFISANFVNDITRSTGDRM